jgi:D-beta-D-heptose 7-phosphate kinase/D-beta-D-heptose 1-phosphate adenosyltransferase
MPRTTFHRAMKLRLPPLTDTRVLVVGDVMLDRYWYGEAARISPEAPVPVVSVAATEERPGGAANVAQNLAALGVACTLVGVVGADAPARALRERLAAAGIECDFVELSDWPTIVKLRVVSHRQQMLRLDFERPLSADVRARLEAQVARHVNGVSVVVLEDYDKGTLADPAALIRLAHAAGARVVVDPKLKPLSAYRGADLVKPNSVEFAHAVGGWKNYDELVAKGAAEAAKHDIGALVVTRGAEGLTLIERSGAHRHVPAREVDVFDETGAGDTVAAALAAALAGGLSLGASAVLANLAAGIAVAKSGTATVSRPELEHALGMGTHADRGIVSPQELDEAVAAARRAGERIVFTNGCFDILHAGHVAYLEEARALGDRLVVAVNDDASVARLKGEGRPVNSLPRRQAVLAALACVDWVTSFGEDTPEALLAHVRPDVLVKGGDYRLDEVVGAALVATWGGEVRVLRHVDDVSTSAIVDRIRR